MSIELINGPVPLEESIGLLETEADSILSRF